LLKEDSWLFVKDVHPENFLPNIKRVLSQKITLVVASATPVVARHPKFLQEHLDMSGSRFMVS